MQKLSELSMALCAVSVVSSIVFSFLPDESRSKPLLKTVAGFISASLVLTCVFSFVDGIKKNDLSFNTYIFDDKSIENYVAEKNTEYLLNEVKVKTERLFKSNDIKCNSISVINENGEGCLQFNIEYTEMDLSVLTKRLYELTKIKCRVIVNGYGE